MAASQAAADAAAATERERQAQALAEEQRQRAEAAQFAQTAAEQAAMAQQRAVRRLRSLVGVLALFFLVAAGLSAFAFQQRGEAQANLTRSEAKRLAAEANRMIATDGNSEVAALLALRSISRVYTTQGDEAIEAAIRTTRPYRPCHGRCICTRRALAGDGRLRSECTHLATLARRRAVPYPRGWIGWGAGHRSRWALIRNRGRRDSRLVVSRWRALAHLALQGIHAGLCPR